MNRYLPFLFFMIIACRSSGKKEKADYNIPAKLVIECIDSAYSYDYKPDTVFRKRITKDSIQFTTETVQNCCDWFVGLKAGKMQDTIKIIDTRAGGIRSVCDCNCLFRVKMEFEKHFFDSTNCTILFWQDKKIK